MPLSSTSTGRSRSARSAAFHWFSKPFALGPPAPGPCPPPSQPRTAMARSSPPPCDTLGSGFFSAFPHISRRISQPDPASSPCPPVRPGKHTAHTHNLKPPDFCFPKRTEAPLGIPKSRLRCRSHARFMVRFVSAHWNWLWVIAIKPRTSHTVATPIATIRAIRPHSASQIVRVILVCVPVCWSACVRRVRR